VELMLFKLSDWNLGPFSILDNLGVRLGEMKGHQSIINPPASRGGQQRQNHIQGWGGGEEGANNDVVWHNCDDFVLIMW